MNTIDTHAHSSGIEGKDSDVVLHQSLTLLNRSIEGLQAITIDEAPGDPEETIEQLRGVNAGQGTDIPKYTFSREMVKELIKDHERMIAQFTDSLTRCYNRFRDNRLSASIRRIIEQHKSISWTLKRMLISSHNA